MARRRDSRDKRTRVLAVVQDLLARGKPVSFASVAKAAGVSNWLVYAEGVREHIEGARARQAAQPPQSGTGRPVGMASLRTDLEMARHEIASLRQERDTLKDLVRRNLGQQLDQVGTGELVARVNELTGQLNELKAEKDLWMREKNDLQEKLAEAVEDLAGARISLRQMVRAASTGSGTTL
ncbi:DUF6262 family protein [Streptomyces parvus]|uniref:DUF6262 family protein n=1 Tax=Streptomyces parvus TaxID=66428 RepID=UPI0037F5FF7F